MNVRGEGAICQSWNSSEMFEEPVERAQTFLHFAAIHPHSHPFTEYTYTSTQKEKIKEWEKRMLEALFIISGQEPPHCIFFTCNWKALSSIVLNGKRGGTTGIWDETLRCMVCCCGKEPVTEMLHPGLSRSCCQTGRGWAEPRRTGTHRRLYEPEKHVTSSFLPSGLFVNCANVCLCKSLSELSSSSSQEMVAPYPLNTSHLLRRHLKLKFENSNRSF